jgi:hypothetical protein
MLEWAKVAGPLLVSWPVAALVIALVFRRPLLRLLDRLTASDQVKAEIGPVKIELGKLAEQGQIAVGNLTRLNLLMAESRLLELEITEANFGRVFSAEQRARMKAHIDELRQLTLKNSARTSNAVGLQ